MGIFYRRPLCLFCFFFLLGALCAWLLPADTVPWCMACLLALGLALLAAALLLSRHRIVLLTLMLCVASLLGSVAHSYFLIDLPTRRAKEWVGEHAAEVLVLDVTYRSSYRSSYSARLVRIDGEKTDLSIQLSDFVGAELEAGDRVYATLTLREICDESGEPLERSADGAVLAASLTEDVEAYALRASDTDLWGGSFSSAKLKILSERAQEFLRERFSRLLGEDTGALASAFLLGDRSGLSAEVERDFRRAGVTHMMAVSGMHIAVLLGGIELLLRRLYIPKRARIAVVAALALFFLFLTGFSLSGLRSVLMLFSVYLHFLLHEENDSLTALFVSVVLILLLLPYSVADLGMWMSFLATLALLTLYPFFERLLSRPKKARWYARLARVGRWALLMVLMTLLCNLFLLPILWLFFGELSWVAPIANLLLSLLSDLFLWILPFVLLLGGVPLLGSVLCRLVVLCGRGILEMTEGLSRFPYATVSLEYAVCRITVPILALTLAFTLIVRLRKKWRALLPLGAAVVVFALSLGAATWYQRTPILTYCQDGTGNELLMVQEGAALSLCDMSDGSYAAYGTWLEQCAATTATELRALVLTHYHEAHASSTEALMRSMVIRSLYLPTPTDTDSLAVATRLCRAAEEQGTRVILYESGDTVGLTDSVSVRVERQEREGEHVRLGVDFFAGARCISYLSSHAVPSDAFAQDSGVVLFGNHGGGTPRAFDGTWSPSANTERFIYTARDLRAYRQLDPTVFEVYRPLRDDEKYTLSFSLS